MIEIQAVSIAFGDVRALGPIDLQVADGEFVCLLGPSGCGKSTLLNAVAGFVTPTSGTAKVRGTVVTRPGPDRAFVFQEYALFPWLTVEENVAFGLRERGAPAREIEAQVSALLEKMTLRSFAKSFPKTLSGGMRQRAAIARALALGAPVLLMDEPFGALDALTRRSLQAELLRIHAESKPTVLFVTHSIEESLNLADRVVVMTARPGKVKKIVPVGLPRPRDPSSPGFIELQRELTALVMEEQQRHLEDELKA